MKTLLSALIAATLSCSACAHAGSLVDVRVIDRDTGSTLVTHPHDGKFFIAGVPGHRYAVRIANRIGTRVLAVLSVDGVNAVTGETASPDQSGYVLDPYQSTEVDGWRKSQSEVAQFNFTALSDSYAARTGRPSNVGVIGVAVFREKPPLRRERDDKIAMREAPATQQPGTASDSAAASPPPAPTMSAGSMAKSVAAAPADARAAESGFADGRAMPRKDEALGTGHGARESSYVSYTQFERESSNPNEVVSVWYDSYNNLIARGVLPTPRPIAVEPQAFPNHFVPDPTS